MSFHLYKPIYTPLDHVYKLVQLPPELLSYIKTSPNEPLQFKSPLSSKTLLVLCTKDTTYTVRQSNHSNTQLLLTDMAINKYKLRLEPFSGPDPLPRLLGLGQSSYIYELTEAEGNIDPSGVPEYDGTSSEGSKTLQQVIEDSPIDAAAFLPQWHALRGSEVDKKAVFLAPKFVTDAVYTLISIVIAEKLLLFKPEDVEAKFAQQNSRYTRPILDTLCGMFCSQENGLFVMDNSKVARWFGIETLKATPGTLTDKKLLLQWKLSLPPFFNAPLDLKVLQGSYFRPSPNVVQYVDKSKLHGEIHSRIKEMFVMVKEWDYEEFLPFVEEFIPSTKKPESVILKYARRKRVGKKFVVCPR